MSARRLFHPVTAAELEAYGQRLSHGIVLYGQEGVGLETAAKQLVESASAQIIQIFPEYKEKVDLEKGRITIDVIRRLYDLMRTKQDVRQCVIITAGDTITIEAQHAFLKLLEEPTDNVSFVLLCHDPQKLLPTVLSRVQQIHVRRIDRHQSEALLTSLKVQDVTTRAQLLFIAEGLPGLLTQLATSPEQLEAEASQLRQARAMIQGSSYQRLVALQGLKDDRAGALKVVSYMIRLLKREVAGQGAATDDTLRLLENLETATTRLEANGNVRLAMAAAML